MSTIHHILAAGDDGVGKVLFGLIFLVLWGVSAIMTQVSKQKEKQRRDRLRMELERQASAPPILPPLPAPRRQSPIIVPPIPAPRPGSPTLRQPKVPHAVTAQRPQPQASPKRKIFPKLKIPRRPPPQPAQPARRMPVEPLRPSTIVAAPVAVSALTPSPRPTSATASTLRAWLRPNTLRQQFILTEVLQPPVGLRE
jgi:hypothetical protein